MPKEMTSFQEKQRERFEEQKRSQRDAIEMLHQYRADEISVLSRTPRKKRTSDASHQDVPKVDARASSYTFSPDASLPQDVVRNDHPSPGLWL